MNILELPFDIYQRHKIIQEAVEILRTPKNKVFRILDAGGGTGPISQFLPNDKVLIVDQYEECDLPNFQKADVLALPFKDKAFDVVLSADVLEHIPSDRRPQFLQELWRVSGSYVLLAAPFFSPENERSEKILYEFIKTKLGYDHHFLKEHRDNGLPLRAETQAFFEAAGADVVVLPNGFISTWLSLMLITYYLDHDGETLPLSRMVSSFYNECYYKSDNCEPAYRYLLVASKPSLSEAAKSRLNQLISPAARTPDFSPILPLLQLVQLDVIQEKEKRIVEMTRAKDMQIEEIVKAKEQQIREIAQTMEMQLAGKDAQSEKIATAKDAQIGEIVKAKDAQIEEIIQARGRQIADIMAAKEQQVGEIVQAKDRQIAGIVQEKERQLLELQRNLDLKENQLKEILEARDRQIEDIMTSKELQIREIIQAKDLQIAGIVQEKEHQLLELHRNLELKENPLKEILETRNRQIEEILAAKELQIREIVQVKDLKYAGIVQEKEQQILELRKALEFKGNQLEEILEAKEEKLATIVREMNDTLARLTGERNQLVAEHSRETERWKAELNRHKIGLDQGDEIIAGLESNLAKRNLELAELQARLREMAGILETKESALIQLQEFQTKGKAKLPYKIFSRLNNKK